MKVLKCIQDGVRADRTKNVQDMEQTVSSFDLNWPWPIAMDFVLTSGNLNKGVFFVKMSAIF